MVDLCCVRLLDADGGFLRYSAGDASVGGLAWPAMERLHCCFGGLGHEVGAEVVGGEAKYVSVER